MCSLVNNSFRKTNMQITRKVLEKETIKSQSDLSELNNIIVSGGVVFNKCMDLSLISG